MHCVFPTSGRLLLSLEDGSRSCSAADCSTLPGCTCTPQDCACPQEQRLCSWSSLGRPENVCFVLGSFLGTQKPLLALSPASCLVMRPRQECGSTSPQQKCQHQPLVLIACLFSPPDKNFEDDDSVDGGRSSSSSKGASLSGRKAVSMGSFRRPSSASSSKSAGQRRRGHVTRLSPEPRNLLCVMLTVCECVFLFRRVQGGTALVLELWTRTTSSRPLKTSPLCRLDASLVPGRVSGFSRVVSSFLLVSPPDLLQQGGGGGHDEDPGRAVR